MLQSVQQGKSSHDRILAILQVGQLSGMILIRYQEQHTYPPLSLLEIDILCNGVFKYYAILLGGGGGHQKVTEDHDQKRIKRMVSKNIGQTEGAQEGYNNSRINYQWVVQKVIFS